eukprot:SAG25_NODE_10029_length_348_cov_0.803213_1_plen_81_part_10
MGRGACASRSGIEGIVNVRLVRDPKTSLGKGIGFVQLDTEAATVAALGVHGLEFISGGGGGEEAGGGRGEKRKLRVFRASA